MANLGDLIARMGLDLSGWDASLQSANDKLNALYSETSNKFEGLQALGSSMMGVGAGLTAAITAPIVGIGAVAIETGEKLNQAKGSFTTMLGSAKEADAFLKQLADFAAGTPFEFPDLVDAGKKLLAMGFAAKDVTPMLRSIGDTVAALGGGKSMIEGVTTALGQMQAKGKVSAEEMGQLAERGIPAWKMLADSIGVSIPQAMKMAEQGAITASQAIPAILQGMNDRFGGQMEQASKSLTGVWSNFKDTLTMTLAQIGQQLTPMLTALVQAAMPLLDWVKAAAKWFSELPAPIQQGAVAMVAMAAAVGPILVAVGGAATAFAALGTALGPVAVALGTTVGALVGWAAAIPIAIGALVALGSWVYENWGPIVAVVRQAWDGVTEIWQGVLDSAALAVQTVFDTIGGMIETFVGTQVEILKLIWSPIEAIWPGAWDSIVSAVTSVWEGVKGTALIIWDALVLYFTALWDGVAYMFKTVWGVIKNELIAVWEAIKLSAFAVWDMVTKPIVAFLEIAKQFPGVNKLMNLDDAWNSAKKLQEGLKGATEEATKKTAAVKKLGDEVKPAAQNIADLKNKLHEVTKAYREGKASADDVTKAKNEYSKAVRASTADVEKHGKAHAEAAPKIRQFKLAHEETDPIIKANTKALQDAQKEIQKLDSDAAKAAQTMNEKFAAEALKTVQVLVAENGLKDAIDKTTAALRTTKGAVDTDLKQAATDAQTAFETLKQSGWATEGQLRQSAEGMYNAWKNYATQSKTEIPPIIEQMAKDAGVKLNDTKTGIPSLLAPFEDWQKNVKTVCDGLATDITAKLFSGEGSWSEIGKKALGSLKSMFVDTFINNAKTAVNDFVEGALKDLLGGKGFGGILDSIGKIKDAWSNVFGAGNAVINNATPGNTPGIPTNTPSVPSGGGGSGSGVGGVGGAVNMVTGIATAVSSIVGNFQMAGMNKSLDLIENYTRYTKIYTGEQGDSILKTGHIVRDDIKTALQVLQTFENNGIFIKNFDDMQAPIVKAFTDLQSVKDIVSNTLAVSTKADWLEKIESSSVNAVLRIEQTNDILREIAAERRQAAATEQTLILDMRNAVVAGGQQAAKQLGEILVDGLRQMGQSK